MDVARALIREPDVSTAAAYRRRVGLLAAIYVALFGLSLLGIGLICWLLRPARVGVGGARGPRPRRVARASRRRCRTAADAARLR